MSPGLIPPADVAAAARRGLELREKFGRGGTSVGVHRAKELAFFADIISADEAAEFGIVNRVVPADELDAFVTGWARRLADGPPLALSMTKSMLNSSFSLSMDQALEEESRSQAVNFSTEDTMEAIAGFSQKRDPKFKGR